jgi:hypothetical protein
MGLGSMEELAYQVASSFVLGSNLNMQPALESAIKTIGQLVAPPALATAAVPLGVVVARGIVVIPLSHWPAGMSMSFEAVTFPSPSSYLVRSTSRIYMWRLHL